MSLAFQSRFSSLQIVEDDYVHKVKDTKVKKGESKNPSKKSDAVQKNKNQKNKSNKPQNGTTHHKKKRHPVQITSKEQWEEDLRFQEDLKQALLLSEIDEHNLTASSKFEDEDNTDDNKDPFKTQVTKKHKKKTLPIYPENLLQIVEHEDIKRHMDKLDQEAFFINRSNRKKAPIRIEVNQKYREQPSDELIKDSQLKSILDEKEKEIFLLRTEVCSLKEEMLKVKSRHKKLCSIISLGKMKEKAEVLAEVVRLREVQNELTNEVASLHAQLEQERSKSTSFSKTESKFKEKKKRTLSDKEI